MSEKRQYIVVRSSEMRRLTVMEQMANFDVYVSKDRADSIGAELAETYPGEVVYVLGTVAAFRADAHVTVNELELEPSK